MAGKTLQIQSVIYNNKKESLMKAMHSIQNAIRVDRQYGKSLESAVVYYGDASPEPVFTDQEISGLKEMFKKEFEFRYCFFNENTGSAKGHNTMGADCGCEYMLIMNPDVILAPDVFEHLFRPFDLDEQAGMVEARQTPIEHSKEYDITTGETDWAATACAVFPRKLFEQLGGFDHETFFLYCDDLDFSWRIRLEGYKLIYQPKAVCFHAKRLSKQGKWEPTEAEKYYSTESAIFIAYKWSNNERTAYLLDMFSKGSETQRKAAAEFEKRRAEGRLPQQIDQDHKIAKFSGDYFTEHRFYLV